MNRQDQLDLGLIGKKPTKLENGVVFIRSIMGDRVYEYKTKFAFNEMLRRMRHSFGGNWTAEYWKCEKCKQSWKSKKWAEKHSCKEGK